jgi:hypothetical protein
MKQNWFACPKCGSKRIKIGDFENDTADFAYRNSQCVECNFDWQEWYQFSHNQDITTGVELENDGTPEQDW